MRLYFVTACIAILLLVASCSSERLSPNSSSQSSIAQSSSTQSQRHTLIIDVSNGDWGEGRIEDIEKVLYSATSQLWSYFPSKPSITVKVIPVETGPATWDEKGPNGEFTVQITAKDRHWARYSYEFAHEFCHVLCPSTSKDKENPNYWFEEALCDTSSLFVLRRMAETWKTSPPYSNWSDYASALKDYSDDYLRQEHRKLPANTSLAEWYRQNQAELKKDKKLTKRVELVASQLLPLFEETPQNWEVISYLNSGKLDKSKSFDQYLKDWLKYSPEKHQGFVKKIGRLFAITVD
jgi:hypothetical protein